jgi:hypothetical protein
LGSELDTDSIGAEKTEITHKNMKKGRKFLCFEAGSSISSGSVCKVLMSKKFLKKFS